MVGTEVTVTVIARDANNNVVPGARVLVSVDSGAFTVKDSVGTAEYVTDANGIMTGMLSIAGNSALRAIRVSASAGSVTSTTKTVNVVSSSPSLSIISTSDTLPSSGAPGTEVTITVMVKDIAHNIIQGATVNMTADSGALTIVSKITDDNGTVTGKLSTGNDPTMRVITVTAVLDPSSGVSVPVIKRISVIPASNPYSP